ncbi:hypothetical protein NXX23_14345 [Bacteroides ovatus]|nr:hypothetical protein [Bacteroides ovatus]
MGGTAVGDDNIKMTLKDETNRIYSYEGALVAGKINFPVDYADELNAIGPRKPPMPLSPQVKWQASYPIALKPIRG